MGHDISAYKPSDKDSEVAYLRRGAFNDLNGVIYEALNCNEFNGGWSGYGEEKIFTRVELQKGLSFVKDDPDYEPEKQFLEDCMANLEEDKILIYFG